MKIFTMRRFTVASAAVAAVAVLAACGSSGGGSSTNTGTGTGTGGGKAPAAAITSPVNDNHPSGTPKQGGTVTVSYQNTSGFDPAQLGDSGGPGFFDALYGTLVSQSFDAKLHYSLADSMDPSADGKTWTIHLHQGAKFSDGTVFDSAAVVWNWKRYQDPATGALFLNLIKGMTFTATDAQTVTVTLPDPNFSFPALVAQYLTYVPEPKYIQDHPNDWRNAAPIGAGPFKITKNTPRVEIDMVPNTNWFGDKPYLDQLIYKAVPSADQSFQSVLAGNIDAYWAVDAQRDWVKQAQGKGTAIYQWVVDGGTTLHWNVRQGRPFADKRVRQALVEAIDPLGLAQAGDSQSTKADLVTSLFLPGSPYNDPSLQNLPYNPGDAQKLFSEVAKETGKPVTFTWLLGINNATWQPKVEYIKSVLDSMQDVKMSIKTLDAPTFVQTQLINHDYDISLRPNSWFIIDPTVSLADRFQTGARNNVEGFDDPAMDAALKAIQAAQTDDARVQAVKDFQKVYYDVIPTWVYSVGVETIFVNPKLTGFDQTVSGYGTPDWTKVGYVS